MKTLPLLAAAALAALAGVALGQEAPPDDVSPAPTPAPASPGVPSTLFPEAGPAASPGVAPGHGRHGAAAGNRRHGRHSQYATDAAVSLANSDPLEVRVAFRKDKTMALVREPGLRDILLQADAARTDDEKRAFLKVYYTTLYRTILKVDPSPAMKAHVALLAQASQQEYDPRRRAVSGEDDLEGVGRNAGRNRR